MTEDADGKHYSNKEAVKVITSAARAPLAFALLVQVGRAIFHGIGVRGISNLISFLHYLHRNDEVVEQCVVGDVGHELTAYDTQFACRSHGRIEFRVESL